jgi:5-methylthioadenosine/S-adenosylhomocysteine deaminase
MTKQKDDTEFSSTRRRFLVAAGVAGAAAAALPHAAAAAQDSEKSKGAAAAAGKEVLLTDAFVITMNPNREVFTNGYVWVKGNSIHQVGSMNELGEVRGVQRRSLPGYVIMPGLVNTHNHISSFGMRAMQDWRGFPGDSAMYAGMRVLDGEGGYLGSAVALLEQLQGGITTCKALEAGSDDCMLSTIRAAEESGARVLISRYGMDAAHNVAPNLVVPEDVRDSIDGALASLDRMRAHVKSPIVAVAPDAFSVMRVSKEMMLALHQYAVKHDLPFGMHAGASENEQKECLEKHGRRIVHYLDDLGVLDSRLLIAHGTWFDDEENALVAKRGASISHCSVPNARGGKFGPLKEWLELGIRVGIGTDGPTSNNSQDIFETAKFAIYGQRIKHRGWGNAETALELLTIRGAQAIGMGDRIGSLELGKAADLICIDAVRPSLSPNTSLLNNLIYSHDRSAVRHVMVNGEWVINDGRHRSLDSRKLCLDLTRWAERAQTKAGLLQHYKSSSPFRYR